MEALKELQHIIQVDAFVGREHTCAVVGEITVNANTEGQCIISQCVDACYVA